MRLFRFRLTFGHIARRQAALMAKERVFQLQQKDFAVAFRIIPFALQFKSELLHGIREGVHAPLQIFDVLPHFFVVVLALLYIIFQREQLLA